MKKRYLMTWLGVFAVVMFGVGEVIAGVVLEKVEVEKLTYFPGDKVKAVVVVKNAGEGEWEGKLKAAAIWRLGEVGYEGEEGLALKVGEAKEKVYEFPSDKMYWGCEFTARVTGKDGREECAGSDIFAVHKHAWAVGQYCFFFPATWEREGFEKRVQEVIGGYKTVKEHCVTVVEYLGVTLCPFSAHTPRTEYYFSGQGSPGYKNSVTLTREFIAGCHKVGVKVVPYVYNCISGVDGTECAREHPEWLYYDSKTGRPAITYDLNIPLLKLMKRFYREYPDSLNNKDLLNEINRYCNDGGAGIHIAAINCAQLDAVEYSVRSIIEGTKFFGWDGLRFDTHYTVGGSMNWQGDPPAGRENPDKLGLRNLKRMKELVGNDFPHFLYGYNWGHDYEDPRGRGGSHRPLEYEEACANGGWILWEIRINDLREPTSKWHEWEKFAAAVRHEASYPRRYGGYLCCGHMAPSYPSCDIYTQILLFSQGSRIADYAGKQHVRNLQRFATRFSYYLYGNDLVQWDDADKYVSVISDREVWWKKYGWQRETEGKHEYILHLINPPVNREVEVKESPLPDVIKGLRVEWKKRPEGKVWICSADPEPLMRKELELKEEGGKVVATVPELKLWSMIVFSVK